MNNLKLNKDKLVCLHIIYIIDGVKPTKNPETWLARPDVVAFVEKLETHLGRPVVMQAYHGLITYAHWRVCQEYMSFLATSNPAIWVIDNTLDHPVLWFEFCYRIKGALPPDSISGSPEPLEETQVDVLPMQCSRQDLYNGGVWVLDTGTGGITQPGTDLGLTN